MPIYSGWICLINVFAREHKLIEILNISFKVIFSMENVSLFFICVYFFIIVQPEGWARIWKRVDDVMGQGVGKLFRTKIHFDRLPIANCRVHSRGLIERADIRSTRSFRTVPARDEARRREREWERKRETCGFSVRRTETFYCEPSNDCKAKESLSLLVVQRFREIDSTLHSFRRAHPIRSSLSKKVIVLALLPSSILVHRISTLVKKRYTNL